MGPGRGELPRYDEAVVPGFHHERLLFWRALADRSRGTPDGIDRGYAAILDGDIEAAATIWGERDQSYEQAIALLHGSPDDGVRAVRLLEDLGANGTAARDASCCASEVSSSHAVARERHASTPPD